METGSILVIDDERGIREGCKRALSPYGYHVAAAESGEEALLMLKAGNFDLALIDVMMPGISGIDLIGHILAHDPDIVCIIITGYATVEMAVRALKQGAYDFLTKPFTTDDLLLVVKNGLERRRLTLETRRLQTIEAEAQRLAQEKARLEELDRAKANFIRLVTHELKAPVAAILTYVDLLLNAYIPPEEQRETLFRIQQRAKEQMELIADLLEFGKLKEMRAEAQAERIHIEEILRQVLPQFEAQAEEKGLNLVVEIAPGLPAAHVNAESMRSIWSNLISNAIKYSLQGGEVKVSLTFQEGELVGQVSDQGIGVPEEAKGRLFSEFFRARNARDLSIPGTGLGLAIVHQALDKAGGRITFESEEGKGSTFTFYLPAVNEPSPSSPGESLSAAAQAVREGGQAGASSG